MQPFTISRSEGLLSEWINANVGAVECTEKGKGKSCPGDIGDATLGHWS